MQRQWRDRKCESERVGGSKNRQGGTAGGEEEMDGIQGVEMKDDEDV